MYITCLDLEGVLVPEIWIAFAEASGIPELKKTTRDEPDYDKLMKWRLGVLKEHGLGLKEIQETIAKIDPIPGAKEFLDELRSMCQVIIISDTLFVNSGPMLKVEMYPVGSFASDIVTNIEEYGINNTLLTISIKIDIMFDTIIPLNKQTINVNCEVPILVQIIQGEVPTYYYQNKDSQYLPMPVN